MLQKLYKLVAIIVNLHPFNASFNNQTLDNVSANLISVSERVRQFRFFKGHFFDSMIFHLNKNAKCKCHHFSPTTGNKRLKTF